MVIILASSLLFLFTLLIFLVHYGFWASRILVLDILFYYVLVKWQVLALRGLGFKSDLGPGQADSALQSEKEGN